MKMLRFIGLLAVLVVFVGAHKVRFENYKVYRVIPQNAEQLELLKQLGDADENYSYWSGPGRVRHPVDLMVSPSRQAEFRELMQAMDMQYESYVEDVQRLIEAEQPKTREGGFGWKRYHSLAEIYDWLDSLERRYPGKVEVVSAGRTYQGRPIKGVKLSFAGAQGPSRPGIFVEGGIHAREWISPATVTYLLNQLLTSEEPRVRRLAEAHDWYMFPSFNPDGYVYTHTQNRLWRKTLSKNGFCKGVDINRNWGYMWMTGGASSNPCSETFAGKKAFSEVETKSMSDYISSIGHKLFAYIAFHSYSQLLLIPYGHTSQHLDNYDESYAIGRKTIKALSERYGTKYVTGNIAETIYVASGGSMDWVKATFKVPISFTYELRDTGKHGFVLPADQIIPNGEEVLDSLITMFDEAIKFGYPKPK